MKSTTKMRNLHHQRPPSPHQLRLSPQKITFKKVERDDGDFGDGVIRAAAIITTGVEALGHDLWIDREFGRSVAAAINTAPKRFRFTHGSLSDDGLGDYLGQVQGPSEFDEETGKVTADLHFKKTSLNAERADHVLDLAESDPDAFGMSIVYTPDIGEEDRFSADHSDEEGKFTSPDEANSGNLRHARLAKLRGADAVSDPAANPDGLFSEGQSFLSDLDNAADYLFGLSDQQPDSVFGKHPERAKKYLERYLLNRGLSIRSVDDEPAQPDSLTSKLWSLLGRRQKEEPKPAAPPEPPAPEWLSIPDAQKILAARCRPDLLPGAEKHFEALSGDELERQWQVICDGPAYHWLQADAHTQAAEALADAQLTPAQDPKAVAEAMRLLCLHQLADTGALDQPSLMLADGRHAFEVLSAALAETPRLALAQPLPMGEVVEAVEAQAVPPALSEVGVEPSYYAHQMQLRRQGRR